MKNHDWNELNKTAVGISQQSQLKLALYLKKLHTKIAITLVILSLAGSLPIVIFSGSAWFTLTHLLICFATLLAGLILAPFSQSIQKELKCHEARSLWHSK